MAEGGSGFLYGLLKVELDARSGNVMLISGDLSFLCRIAFKLTGVFLINFNPIEQSPQAIVKNLE